MKFFTQVKMIVILILMQGMAISQESNTVLLGIDNLIEMGFAPLAGKRIALLTNTSGRTGNLELTASMFAQSEECSLVCILTPEHGFYATALAGQEVGNDSLYSVPTYSLYGKYRRPVKSMLESCDIVVVDIQDIGIRSYTYISTLYNLMDACAEFGKPILILDRPNPLGGLIVDGSVADQDMLSFVGIIPIPYLHGLTIGEFALYVNGEGLLPKRNGKTVKAELQVLKMKHWKRSMSWEQTGLKFVPTSPNIPTVNAIRGCAITGPIGEIGSAAIGIGTSFPFQYCASPDIYPEAFHDYVKENLLMLGIQSGIGVYRISTGKYPNKDCKGIMVFSDGNPNDKPYSAGIELLLALRHFFPEQFTKEYVKDEPKSMFRKIIANNELVNALLLGGSDDEVRASLNKGKEEFESKREKYFLYPIY
ncbi:MAG: exo-beta-N-acetylmuramidase NamZ domain-containing protein [Ignavibacteria bacterium]